MSLSLTGRGRGRLWLLIVAVVLSTGSLAGAAHERERPRRVTPNKTRPMIMDRHARDCCEPDCPGCKCRLINSLCGEVFFAVDGTFLKALRQGFDYAVKTDDGGNFNDLPNGRMEHVELEHDPGFRVSVGYRKCREWDVVAYYAYHHDKESQEFAPGVNLLNPTRGLEQIVEQNYDSALGRAEVKLNDFGIHVGRKWCCFSSTRARAFAGVRYATIDQHFGVTYTATNPAAQVDTIEDASDMDAIGPVMGIEVESPCYCRLGVFGKTSLSLLHADFTTNQRQLNDGTLECDQIVAFKAAMPVLEMLMGLQYSCCDFQAKFGYELQWWMCGAAGSRVAKNLGSNHDGRFFPVIFDLGFAGPFVRVDFGF